ncbi:hypothetical protein MAPG_02031 [Magnaporthiopsis poae ATCC 64411]|uniref:Uncharacterized protein n=1 Tax=Magnaporthiopsis poae (strain ATCC 64411 / 73-15) TaxID=644358 RepID=A0A0C4DQ93_MAGP6|nr:hypothetical protein MAPG_02031 [Magnaporthiopsis poae ATCC 64411]
MYFSMKTAGVALLVASQVAAVPLTHPRFNLPKFNGRTNYLGIGPAVYPDSSFKQRGHTRRDEEATGQLQARKIPVVGLGPAEPVTFEPVNPEKPQPESGHSRHRKPKGDLSPGSKPSRLHMGMGPAKGFKAKPVILPRGHRRGMVEMPAPRPGRKMNPKMIAASPIPVREGGKPVALSRRDDAAAAADEEALESRSISRQMETSSIGRTMETSYIPGKKGGDSHLRLPRSDSPESAEEEEADESAAEEEAEDEEATELQARGYKDNRGHDRDFLHPRSTAKPRRGDSRPILPRSDVPAADEGADEEAFEEASEEASELQVRDPRKHYHPLLPGRGPILPRSEVDETA